MRAGKLTERITIQQLVVSKGASGGIQRAWVDFALNLPASRRDLSGNEQPASAQAGGQQAVARTEFTVRWLTGVAATMRVLHEGEMHNIKHVNNFAGRRESLILTCETGANNG